jgi:phosphorylcholine metabolism protein LicD
MNKSNIYDNYTNNKKCDFEHPILKKNDLVILREVLDEFLKFSKLNNINYFAVAGTLIGTVRQSGLMPLDDDIDFGILENDIIYFKNYNMDNVNSEFTMLPFPFGYKLYKNINKMIVIDIFVFKLIDEKYRIMGGYYPKESFEIDEILPLKILSYNDLDINVPNKYTEYLDRVFPKWDTLMINQCDHFTRKCIYKNVLKLDDILPVNEDNKYMCYSSF